ncbi:MAG: radical SAM protein [Chloroflexi bacterium]|nr:radical SAM protein [Chloroflexota bacterium]
MKWEQIAEAKRILARETGTIFKDWGGKLAVALIYPNTYYVGMSSLGLQTLYRLFNARHDVVCERVFYEPCQGWEPSQGFIALESQRPLTDFGLLAFTLSYEMDYFHVVKMLQQTGIPPLAAQRDSSWPLVIAGGPAISANPEPMAPFFDAIVIGEGEEIIGPLVDACQETLGERETTLAAWAEIRGIYIPQTSNFKLQTPKLKGTDGSGFGVRGSGLRAELRTPNWQPETWNLKPVERRWVRDLSRYPTHSVVLTPDTEFGDLYLIEIARGCGRGCRFCLSGYLYRPPRERPLEMLLEQAQEGLQHRQRIGLVSAAVSDYGRRDELASRLRAMGARISVSSLRADSLTETLVRALAESSTQTLTIAPEVGCERLRQVISKTQSEQDLLQAVEWAAAYRFPQLKLYFMLGHPTETDEDMEALLELVREAQGRFPRRLTINLTPFVPKPHTPFQWAAMTPGATLQARQDYVKQRLRGSRINVKADSPAWAEVQGVLSRGDRRLAQALLKMDRLSLAGWRRALKACGLTAEEFLRERRLDEPLPWQVVDSGVSTAFLRREWRLSREEKAGYACPPGAEGCVACGVCETTSVMRDA